MPRSSRGENALRKALAAGAAEGEIVLGVDTLVATEREIWGKPPNAAAAAETLRRLSGRTHTRGQRRRARCAPPATSRPATATTEVTFRTLDERARRLVRRDAANGRDAPAATRSRGGARRSSSASTATTSTSSGCPSPR